MLAGVNDSRRARARSSPSCSTGDIFKVNLIPYNPTGMYDGSSRERDRRVQGRRSHAAAFPPTVRLTRGRDIAAACGQLAAIA